MTSIAILNISATTWVNTPVTISLSGLIKSGSTCEVLTGTATAVGQNIMYVPESGLIGNSLVEVQCSDGNKVAITIAIVDRAPVTETKAVRRQTRETTMAGKDVEDRFWTVTDDSGPIEGPSAAFVPLRINKVTSMVYTEGNPPENSIDGKSDTFYSTEGVGSWIQFDLGHLCNISEIDITWHGTNNFSLAISPDRKILTNVYQGRGLGVTNIKMPKASAVLVKVTSMSDFMTIFDVKIKGSPSTPKPTATGAQAVLGNSSFIVEPGQLVVMDGTLSRGDIIKYVWDQSTAPTVQLFNADTSTCSFVAPDVETPTTLQYSLTIVDRNGQYSKADALVHVKPKPVEPIKVHYNDGRVPEKKKKKVEPELY